MRGHVVVVGIDRADPAKRIVVERDPMRTQHVVARVGPGEAVEIVAVTRTEESARAWFREVAYQGEGR